MEPGLSPELRARVNAKHKKVERGEIRNISLKDASNLFFARITGMMLLHEHYGEEFDVTLDEHLDKSLQPFLEFIERVNWRQRTLP